jgi:DNA ligase-1
MNETQLFRQHAGSVGQWRISSEGPIISICHSTVLGGSEVHHKERVQTNLSGRSLEEQVKLRINSRISRMRDRGYKDTVEEAQRSTGNQLGLLRPMLAHPITRVNHVPREGDVDQKKLDGHRCLITRQDGELIAYSRQGKRIDAISHILRAISPRIPEGVTVDGELYCHGYILQTLASWIKREQPSTYNLFFVAYDIVAPDTYTERHAELSGILRDVDTQAPGKIVVLPFRPYRGEHETAEFFREVRADGFEGLMRRVAGRGYEDGKRSSALLKIKEFHDDEFEVLDITPSKEGWGVLHCRRRIPGTDRFAPFKCSAPGSHAEKLYALEHKEDFIGKQMVTVEYAHITKDEIPFQPTATRWRVDV